QSACRRNHNTVINTKIGVLPSYPRELTIDIFRATVVQEVKKSFSNQKVASLIPCRTVLEQDTEPLIAPDGQCAISVNVKMCIHPCKSLWIKASAKCQCRSEEDTWVNIEGHQLRGKN